MVDKSFYNTILSQVFSPCGNFLVVGDIYGQVSVFNLFKILNPEGNVTSQDRRPKCTFTVQDDIQINSLLATENHLLVGTVGEITAYNWKNLTALKDIKHSWKISLPIAKDTLEKVDVNCMIFDEKKGVVYAACDNNINMVNIESGSVSHVMMGHSNYIHNLYKFENDLLSCGEDGLVNIWDTRMRKVANKIEPYKNDKIARPELGKWIGAVALNEDWLLCGGGPRLSLWHYRSLNVSTIFPIEDKGIHVAQFYEDKILAGGCSRKFYQMSINGDIISEILTSSVSIFSAVYHNEPYKALCLSGSSPNIDICSSNFNYRDQMLSLSKYYEC